ncbi:MAG: hypothetical protein L3J17_10090 [Candidatus Jettenia sp.]|nr:MAG: hypothetical protein L3J17_10090 [Candidatus Jettenia sp.]
MEIRNLSWGNPTENDFDLILDFYSGTKINSDRTSSVPLAQYWKNTNNAITFIAQKIKLQSNSVSIYFEYPTKSAGRNKSSMSDVMIVSDKCKIAIEGKFTEYQKAEYESIKKGIISN